MARRRASKARSDSTSVGARLPRQKAKAGEAGLTLVQRLAVLERERPWIELYHEEDFTLSHAWLINSKPMGISYPAFKYRDVNTELRTKLQAEWNAPVRWPAYVLIIAVIGLALPAVRSYYRERL